VLMRHFHGGSRLYVNTNLRWHCLRGDFSVHSFDKSSNHTHFHEVRPPFLPLSPYTGLGNNDASGWACLNDASLQPPPPSPLKLIDRIRAQKELTLSLEGGPERDKQEMELGGCLSKDAKDLR
jgi:hypothetical protein